MGFSVAESVSDSESELESESEDSDFGFLAEVGKFNSRLSSCSKGETRGGSFSLISRFSRLTILVKGTWAKLYQKRFLW